MRLSAVAFLVFSLSLAAVCQPGSALGQGGATVVTAEVIQRAATSRKVFLANITPHRRATIGSAVDGRVLEYPIDAGQPVEAGETIAQLRTGTIAIDILAAEAELELREAELEELENGSRPEEIALAEAQLAAARAQDEYASARFSRSQQLYEQSAGISQDEFEASRAEALQAAAQRAEAENQLALVQQGPREEKIAQARARRAMQQQAVALLKDRERKYSLKSPFDGFVSQELTEQGAWVTQGDAVAEVVEINPVEVEVFVPEENVRFVPLGGTCEVRVEAFPGQTFPGTIDRIVPVADARSRTFPVRIVVRNDPVDGKHPLLPGMLSRVSLASGSTTDALLVPKDAINLGGRQITVIKVVDGKAVPVPIEMGVAMGGTRQVIPVEAGSLSIGDPVVIRGNERLRPGQSVQVASTEATENYLDADSPAS
jgi:RND family efflux transporter MFP subunit